MDLRSLEHRQYAILGLIVYPGANVMDKISKMDTVYTSGTSIWTSSPHSRRYVVPLLTIDITSLMTTATVRHCGRRRLRPRRLVCQDLHPTFLPPTQPRQALPADDLRHHDLRRCIQSPQYSPLYLGM